MNHCFQGWAEVKKLLHRKAETEQAIEDAKGVPRLNAGQRASLHAIAERIAKNGLIIADEVGMGKTRIAVEVARCVKDSGGRVAILVPPGLSYQWKAELREGGILDVPEILRGMKFYYSAWEVGKPWFDERTVMVSHAFSNWRLGRNAEDWRWTLLPEVYACVRRLKEDTFRGRKVTKYPCVYAAAQDITNAVPHDKNHPGQVLLTGLLEDTDIDWQRLRHSSEYTKSGRLRQWLERIVGLGLGVFDLVIIDEAHKSRGTESGLTRLLDNFVLSSSNNRRLALTATPVELDVGQWHTTLSRVGVEESVLGHMQATIDQYANAVSRVRQSWSSSQDARDDYKRTARNFQEALSPYFLRRDKRDDEAVKLFKLHSHGPINAYRHETELAVETSTLSASWRQAVCAAEALSIVTRQADDPVAKRLRLTLGNGHGIAALLDQVNHNDIDDRKQDEYDEARQEQSQSKNDDTPDQKREARVQWWLDVMRRAFTESEDSLLDHPAILAAVKDIENATRQDEKVLVFGHFTAPMRALVNLLNAREMLRRLENRQPWPQSKIHRETNRKADNSEWAAVTAAHRQLGCSVHLDKIDEELRQRYDKERNRRDRFRETLIKNIGLGMKDTVAGRRMCAIFTAFKRAVENDTSDQQEERHPLALVSRALAEYLDTSSSKLLASRCSAAFQELVEAAGDRDDADNDDEVDDGEALWQTLQTRLTEEFNAPQGRFARMMYGATKPETRRMLQLAFNRPNSFPKVLVAQSLVGREGLNLHKACRILVLLHPEWNPGAVEQQIGRVDRVGSHWSKALKDAIALGKPAHELPRIEVHSVVFRGTYDEHRWRVLQRRSDDLRAQLHGVVIPPLFGSSDPKSRELIDDLCKAAPDFSPLRQL